MTLYEFINKMPLNKTINFILIAFGLVIAPFWFYVSFLQDLVELNDFPSIVLFCLSYSTPMLILQNFVLQYIVSTSHPRNDVRVDKELFLKTLSLAATYIGFLYYVPSLVYNFFNITGNMHPVKVSFLMYVFWVGFPLVMDAFYQLSKKKKLKP